MADQPTKTTSVRMLWLLITAAFVAVLLLFTPSIPLGVPGEWTWARRSIFEIDPVAILFAGLLAAAYWITSNWWLRKEEVAERNTSNDFSNRQSERSSFVRPLATCILGLFWLGGMLLIFPDFHGIGRSPTVLYYKRTEGYFWQAAFDVQDSRQFLSGYRSAISQGDDPDRYLHLGTHPPGLTLAYRGLLTLMERCPSLAQVVVAAEPSTIREALANLRELPTPRGDTLRPAEEATLWAATLITLLATAVTAWPIYRLTERMSDRGAATRAALLWPLIPSLLIFFPKSDLLCPLIATTSCWLWLDGWTSGSRVRCLLAGVGFFCGLMLTLALAPVALLLVIQTSLERWGRSKVAGLSQTQEATAIRDQNSSPFPSVRHDILSVLWAVVGLAVPLSAISLWGQCNVVGIWFENLHNHAMFYDHNSRSYGQWLCVNPLEAAMALGAPLACFVAVGLIRAVKERKQKPVAVSQSIAWLTVWSILWLSGKNMGEAARLWIFLAPWPVMTAALGIDRGSGIQRVMFGIQLAICVATIAVIDGFHFADVLKTE